MYLGEGLSPHLLLPEEVAGVGGLCTPPAPAGGVPGSRQPRPLDDVSSKTEFSEGDTDAAVSAVCLLVYKTAGALVLLLVHNCYNDVGEGKNSSERHEFSRCQLPR